MLINSNNLCTILNITILAYHVLVITFCLRFYTYRNKAKACFVFPNEQPPCYIQMLYFISLLFLQYYQMNTLYINMRMRKSSSSKANHLTENQTYI